MTVAGRLRPGFDVSDQLTVRRAMKRCRNRHFDAKFISPMRLAFADAFSLRGVEAVDLLSRLPWTLKTNPLSQIKRPHRVVMGDAKRGQGHNGLIVAVNNR